MKIQIIFFICLSLVGLIAAHVQKTNIVHTEATSAWDDVYWKKKLIWKPRWVKTWQEKRIYVAVWKKVWGPLEVKEWLPLPKPPPGWTH